MTAGDRPTVGIVLAGGGARGAYEIGALAELLPVLEERGERPSVIVGTSVGALNAGYLAATSSRPVAEVTAEGARIWRETTFRDVLSPLVSPRALGQGLAYLWQLLGIRNSRAPGIVDPAPLKGTLERLIPFADIPRCLEDGSLHAAAVVATSALTSQTVVFHAGGGSPPRDDKRGINYVEATLTSQHVQASAAIPALFPAVHVDAPEAARGWYWDGGARLNTPIKPALELGAEKVIVLALNSVAGPPPGLAGEQRPDAVEGLAHYLHAMFVDPLVNDMATLAGINRRVAEGDPEAGGREAIPYAFIAPRERDAIGTIAMEVLNEHYRTLRGAWRSRDLVILGRMVAGGSDPLHGELASYLFFAPEFAEALLELGRSDARRWLEAAHDDGPWEIGGPGPEAASA